jgi:hypothetical protein
MANAPGTTIHWADELVDHFSSFFPSQWDRIVADSIANAQLPWQDTAYTIATLQEILDCITQGAQQAASKGFSPSLHYSKTLPASTLPAFSAASLVAMRDILERILATDRRNYGVRNGLVSCGDFWFHGIRLALKSELLNDCLDDHAATAQYFGKGGYTAMLRAGRSADELRRQAANDTLLSLTAGSLVDLSHCLEGHRGLQFRHLHITADPDTQPSPLTQLNFGDCEFASGAIATLAHASLEHCRLMADSTQRYEQVRFKDCSMTSSTNGETVTPPLTDAELPEVEFHQCHFETPLWTADTIAPHLQDCEFAANRVHGLDIASLSGDYSATEIEHCRIDHITAGTRIGRLSHSVVSDAGDAYFDGDLEDVEFSNGATACQFGNDHSPSRMTRVHFGRPGSNACKDSLVIDCSFAKRLQFTQVDFHCLLQDPVFLGPTAGIGSIACFRATKGFRPPLTGIEFGSIKTSRDGIVYNVVGGSIIDLDATIKHLSHTVIETVAKKARIGTYEIIMDRALREQWHIKSNPTLIGTIAGHIDTLGFMGQKCGEFFVDKVSGEIADLHHCIKIRRLDKGARVVFSEDTDIEVVFRKRQILAFNGGVFGLWEQGDAGEKSIRYFYDDKDYHQRHMIDNVKDMFDAFD